MINSKIIKIVTKVQLLAWLLLILSDLIQEMILIPKMINDSDYCLWFSIIFVFIIPIWYLKKEKELCNNMNISKLKLFILSSVIWIIETTIIGGCLWFALGEHLWIKQNTISDIWNGLEYLIFPYFLAVIPVLIIIIVKIINFLYLQLKRICNPKQ